MNLKRTRFFFWVKCRILGWMSMRPWEESGPRKASADRPPSFLTWKLGLQSGTNRHGLPISYPPEIQNSYWTWPFIVIFPIQMVIFISYVEIPEGIIPNLRTWFYSLTNYFNVSRRVPGFWLPRWVCDRMSFSQPLPKGTQRINRSTGWSLW